MKKLLTLILAALLCLSFFGLYGCNSNESPSSADTSTEQPSEIQTEEEIFVARRIDATVLSMEEDNLLKIKPYQPPAQTGFPEEYDAVFQHEMYLQVSRNIFENLCKGDLISLIYQGTTGETINGLPVCKARDVRIINLENATDKPVIYLYPTVPTEVSVKLTLNGRLTCTYPDYSKGWDNFTAHPDGTLIFPDGKEYYCLYWEGMQDAEWDFSTGFCVKGSDTAAFLEWALAAQGLTPREANEFIIYWLPLMQNNPYNVISFQTDAYTSTAVLEITPKPDSLLRIMMTYYPSDKAVEITPQEFEGFERDGFTVVEWGGSQVKKP